MQEHLKHYENQGKFTKIASIGDGGLKLTEFGIITLKAGESYASASGAFEVALIVLGGTCEVRGEGFAFTNVGSRKDVFSGKPHTVYIPCGTEYTVIGTTDVEVAWAASPSDLKTAAYEITPAQVKEAHIGKENYQRDALLMLTDAFPSSH
ncbi:MAG: 5-deoxy-glucuronate isomerase, partial [Kiritimatiellae bacterium]|nr:5-deoxy-glucuronate isomerase [Kiritimatiellia bacterium]